MAYNETVSTEKQSPLLYWLALAYVVGVPNFVHFDTTGRTANPVNAGSIAFIIQAVLTGYLLVVVLLLEKGPIFRRKVSVSLWLWLCLLFDFLIVSFLHPESRLTAPKPTDLLLPLFLLGQWTVAFVLFVSLYARTPAARATEFVVKFIGRVCWVWIAIVWFVVPIMPSQAYGSADDSASAVRRLGGQLIHPGKLSLIASIGFFYALFFLPKGMRKWVSCTIAFGTLVLTGSRTSQLAFILSLFLYAIFYARQPALRYAAIAVSAVGAVVGIAFYDVLLKYVSRGQSLQTLASLDDRTRIWSASFEAISTRPFLGYGYCVGARNALRDHWKYVHWIPPHAHNEFIQAMLEGGVFALALVLALYGLVCWHAFKNAKRGLRDVFLLLVLFQFLVTTMSGPLFTYWFSPLGGMLLMCFIAILGGRRRQQEPVYLDDAALLYEEDATEAVAV